jgi:antitoxin VapB
MALNIKNREAELLANQVATLTGDSLTGAVIGALKERRAQLERSEAGGKKLEQAREFLQRRFWSKPKPRRRALSDDALLGFGRGGA